MTPIALTPAVQQTNLAEPKSTDKSDEQTVKAAKQFESMMLTHMLEAMQKTAQMGSKHEETAYMSMATQALADGIEQGGGLGLADLVAHSLQHEIAAKKNPGGNP